MARTLMVKELEKKKIKKDDKSKLPGNKSDMPALSYPLPTPTHYPHTRVQSPSLISSLLSLITAIVL
jgi:hypothetical protein